MKEKNSTAGAIFSLGAVLRDADRPARVSRQEPSERGLRHSRKRADADQHGETHDSTALDHAIRRCLAKEVERRWQSAADLAGELQWITKRVHKRASGSLVHTAEFASAWPGAWRLPLAVVLAPVAFLHLREKPPAPAAPVRFQIRPLKTPCSGPFLSLSLDGRKLAFVDGGRLRCISWSRENLANSKRMVIHPLPVPRQPLHRVCVPRKAQEDRGRLVAAAQTVADLPGARFAGGAWNQDGVIVFGSPIGLFRVPASGGVPVQITAVDPARQEVHHIEPSFLPDGRHFLDTRYSADKEKSGVYVGSVDAKPEQQSSKFLVATIGGQGTRLRPTRAPATCFSCAKAR